MTEDIEAQEYEKPKIVDYGDLKELTAGLGVPQHLVGDLPRSTEPLPSPFSFS
jgi:hypothetical protein